MTAKGAGVALLLALCGSLAGGCRPANGQSPAERLTIFAASSLTESFTELERAFEAGHPGVDVLVTFAGSQVLRLQLEQGATADLFASANADHIERMKAAGLIGASRAFAASRLALITPPDDPAGVRSFADLRRAERIVVGAANVPIGRYTDALLRRAATHIGEDFAAVVRGRIVSRESNVRLVRAKVELGEADAAIVYRTDALASKAVRSVAIPAGVDVSASYHIGRLHDGPRAKLAAVFTAWLGSSEARAILTRHGFSAGGG